MCADGPKVNKYVREAFAITRFIVTVGWSIYLLGYFFGYLRGAVEDDVLNLVYNLADFVNKIAAAAVAAAAAAAVAAAAALAATATTIAVAAAAAAAVAGATAPALVSIGLPPQGAQP